MPFWFLAVLSFLAAFVLDVLWALYIRRTAQGAAWQAALYAAVLYALGAYNTLNIVANPWLLVPVTLGAGAGTYVIVRREAK
jgi:hypothetical protein